MSLQARFKKPTAPPVPFSGPRLFTFKQAAEYIAHSLDLVREMVDAGEIPYVPKGKGKEREHRLIDRLDLDRYIERKKVGDATP